MSNGLDLTRAVEEALSLSHEILPQTIDDVIAIVREHDAPLIEARYAHREQRAFDRGYDNAMEGIEERVREAQAEAWDEGHAIGALDQVNLAYFNIKPTPNPYRDEESNA